MINLNSLSSDARRIEECEKDNIKERHFVKVKKCRQIYMLVY